MAGGRRIGGGPSGVNTGSGRVHHQPTARSNPIPATVAVAEQAPVSIDGRFDDWSDVAVAWTDPAGDGTGAVSASLSTGLTGAPDFSAAAFILASPV